ncbi:hypothetical protein SAMN05192535_2840 [Shouchella rhizosphaerae]|jgi:hypothetical protein|nr:hypothetical protein SAMN05192535_2840 [Shouchella rhizosphaerae]
MATVFMNDGINKLHTIKTVTGSIVSSKLRK